MEEEIMEDPFRDYEVKEVATTACEHYYVEDRQQDPNSDMTSIICTKCPSGANITSEFTVKDGKIVRKDGK